jgi:CRISPR/Cas system CSM-associated protein Csm3 (group 7 of RAMP superfamily)
VTAISLIRIDLELTSAGGVTAPETDASINLPLAQDAHQRPYLPPASLAGGLRAHFGRTAEEFFGPRLGAGTPASSRLTPSPIRLLGSDVALPQDRTPFTVQSTAIDPHRAAAMSGSLRGRQLLPTGTTIRCYLRTDPGLVERAVEQIATWRPAIGRGRTSGSGQAQVTAIAWRTLDLNTLAGLRDWLLGGREGLFPTNLDDYEHHRKPTIAKPTPALTVTFLIVDPLSIGATTDAQVRRIRAIDGCGAPLLPGTTWKGVLRSRCAYILRSCQAATCQQPGPTDHAGPRPTGRPCGTCPICRLFGHTGDQAAPGAPIGRAGRLEFRDAPISDPQLRTRNHVAIDRFTGAARDGLLFAQEVVTAGSITLEIHTGQPLDDADRGLLLLAIRDIHDGYVGVGGATTRGCGTLRLTPTSHAILDELRPDQPVGRAVLTMLGGPA